MLNSQDRKVIIIVISSIIVALVMYGVLDSTGAIEAKGYKFGGAIAGFLATAYLLNRIYGSQETKTQQKPGKNASEKDRGGEKKPVEDEGKVRKAEEPAQVNEIGKKQSESRKLVREDTPLPQGLRPPKQRLVKELENFFSNYDKMEKEIEEYAHDLSKLLHELAAELKAKERQSINDLSSSLETDIRQIRDLDAEVRQTKSTKDEARLKEVQRQVSRNINDFRSGDILKRYRQN